MFLIFYVYLIFDFHHIYVSFLSQTVIIRKSEIEPFSLRYARI